MKSFNLSAFRATESPGQTTVLGFILLAFYFIGKDESWVESRWTGLLRCLRAMWTKYFRSRWRHTVESLRNSRVTTTLRDKVQISIIYNSYPTAKATKYLNINYYLFPSNMAILKYPLNASITCSYELFWVNPVDRMQIYAAGVACKLTEPHYQWRLPAETQPHWIRLRINIKLNDNIRLFVRSKCVFSGGISRLC